MNNKFSFHWWWCGDDYCNCHQPVILNNNQIIDEGPMKSMPTDEDWDILEKEAHELCLKYNVEYAMSSRERLKTST